MITGRGQFVDTRQIRDEVMLVLADEIERAAEIGTVEGTEGIGDEGQSHEARPEPVEVMPKLVPALTAKERIAAHRVATPGTRNLTLQDPATTSRQERRSRHR